MLLGLAVACSATTYREQGIERRVGWHLAWLAGTWFVICTLDRTLWVLPIFLWPLLGTNARSQNAARGVYAATCTALLTWHDRSTNFPVVLDRFAMWQSSLLSGILGTNIVLSTTGLRTLSVLMALISVAITAIVRPVSRRKALARAAVFVGMWIAYLATISLLVKLNCSSTKAFLLGDGFTLLVITVMAVFERADRRCPVESNTTVRPRWFVMAASLLVVFSIVASLGMRLERQPELHDSRVVIFDTRGLSEWEPVTFDRLSFQNAGMFGLLPEYLHDIGFKCILTRGPVVPELLESARIFVVVNPTMPYPDAEADCIWAWVSSGGSLLILDDHTREGGPANTLLSRVPLEMRFDSAVPSRVDWVGSYSPGYHPAVARLNDRFVDNSDLCWGIGASVETGPGAIALLTMRYGFSDAGDLSNREGNLLGDFTWRREERLGDSVLAAEARYGKGRVVVFGDTSPFQNRPLMFTFESLTGPLFLWLAGPASYSHLPIILLAALALLGLLLLGLMGHPRFRDLATWLVSLLLIAVAGCMCSVAAQKMWARNAYKPPVTERTAIVDYGHGEAIDRYIHAMEDGVSGLGLTLTRIGYLPRVKRLEESDLERPVHSVFLPNPTRPLSTNMTSRLLRYATEGGHVVLSSGYQTQHAIGRLLDTLGITILNIPLGPVPLYVSNDPKNAHFVEAWQMQLQSDSAVIAYETNDHRVIVATSPVGEGYITVVSDPRFFSDNNIEYIETASITNMRFIEQILSIDRTSGKGGQK